MPTLRKLLLTASVVAVPFLGIAGPALASESTSASANGTLPPGARVCAGPIGPSAPGDFTITGGASGPVRWTIWADNDPVFDDPADPTPRTKIFKVNDTSVSQTVLSNASHHWGCAFNEFSSTATVSATVTISE